MLGRIIEAVDRFVIKATTSKSVMLSSTKLLLVVIPL